MKPKVVIIGESCTDEYIFGTCNRVCPEAAALCFTHKNKKRTNKGMAANVFSNFNKLNESNIVECDFIHPESTITKRRFIDIKYNTILFREDINDYCDRIKLENYNLDPYSHIILSDYDKGFLTEEDIISIGSQHSSHATIFIDTKKKLKNIASFVNFIKINYSEFLSNINDIQDIINHSCLIVTEGEAGASLYQKEKHTRFPTEQVILRDVCGAGDTFLAALVFNFCKTKDIFDSIKFANICASSVVSKFGVSTI
jgi:bifunctional ADP-heptose synthase (sugar kinase/adenylyltransferase)